MVSFESDYIAGAHQKVLEALVRTNMVATPGYGSDNYTKSACEKIKNACGLKDAEVFFLVGGTQTNQVVISTMLKGYEGVVAADTGHVSAHEAGAIEYSGVKVLTVPGHNGKMDATELRQYIADFYNDGNHEHMVFPGMVYISYPTEYGSLYSKNELEAIAAVCHDYEIPLYVDGARLAYGLASRDADITLEELAGIVDVFYIGGTKVGALCGEAVVFTKGNMPKHFVNQVKKRGALLAKGRLLGVQFDTLFTDDLYMEIGKYAIDKAEQLKNMLKAKKYAFFYESPTNQQFVILDNDKMQKLSEKVAFSFWEKYSETQTVIRLATSWSTTEEDMKALEEVL